MKQEKLIKIIGITLIVLTIVLLVTTLIINIKMKNNKQDNSLALNSIEQSNVIEENNIATNEVINEATNEVANGNIENNNIVVNSESAGSTIDNEATDYEPDNLIGTLQIPKINVDAEIMEGTTDEVLASYIGHFENTSIWDGNVALASHNRGNNVVHYFQDINQLVEGDEIIYTTKVGERRYQVFSTKEISSTDWSITEESTENIITLMTCITGEPDLRYCVQAREVI